MCVKVNGAKQLISGTRTHYNSSSNHMTNTSSGIVNTTFRHLDIHMHTPLERLFLPYESINS